MSGKYDVDDSDGVCHSEDEDPEGVYLVSPNFHHNIPTSHGERSLSSSSAAAAADKPSQTSHLHSSPHRSHHPLKLNPDLENGDRHVSHSASNSGLPRSANSEGVSPSSPHHDHTVNPSNAVSSPSSSSSPIRHQHQRSDLIQSHSTVFGESLVSDAENMRDLDLNLGDIDPDDLGDLGSNTDELREYETGDFNTLDLDNGGVDANAGDLDLEDGGVDMLLSAELLASVDNMETQSYRSSDIRNALDSRQQSDAESQEMTILGGLWICLLLPVSAFIAFTNKYHENARKIP
jgi:hypothetical protein